MWNRSLGNAVAAMRPRAMFSMSCNSGDPAEAPAPVATQPGGGSEEFCMFSGGQFLIGLLVRFRLA